MLRKIRQYQKEDIQISRENILDSILLLGNYLKANGYIGYDGKVGNTSKEISTVLSSSLIGWLTLYKEARNKEYLENASYCLQKIIESQTKEGCWLYPYAFRKNAPEFPYACENFMTLRSLFYAYETFSEQKDVIKNSISNSLKFLINQIGYEEGVFWYSSADKIRVPNISSMACNAFALAANLFHDAELKNQALIFARYCIKNQSANGAYPYFENKELIYIPYHALETWELREANRILNLDELEKSTDQAIIYLENYISNNGYRSRIPDNPLKRAILFKTPIWAAKAFLTLDNFQQGYKNYICGLNEYRVPGQDNYYYFKKEYGFRNCSINLPVYKSQFIRYNASAFETGTLLLQNWI